MESTSEKKTNLILYIVLGLTFVGLSVLGWLYVSKMIDPEKRAEREISKEGGTQYTLALKKGQAGDDDPEAVASALRLRFESREIEHVGVVVADGGKLIITVPDSAGAIDQRLLKGAGRLSFHMAHPDFQRYMGGEEAIVPGAEMFPFRDPSRTMLVWKKSEIDGSELKRARAANQVGRWEIYLSLKSAGAAKFYDLSKANNGVGAVPFAIILDGEIYSAPVFNEPIAGGTAVISGDFTEAEVRLLTTMMMIPLPAEVELLSEEKVLPGK